MTVQNIAVIGSSGTIGHALTKLLAEQYPQASIHAYSRGAETYVEQNIIHQVMDYTQEAAIESAATTASARMPLDWVIVTTGMLHDQQYKPEKTLKALSAEQFMRLFSVNTIVPAMIAKYFIPTMNTTSRSVFAALSARVGSIADNRLGGWYSYRASKAALNMVIKNAAIETARSNKQAIIVALHPGTVDSPLSKPFQKNVPEQQLLTPATSAKKMLAVLQSLTGQDNGHLVAWDEKAKPIHIMS